MGVVVPNFASSTEDRASGAQVIDGSLKFDKSKNQYLQWTPSSPGNRKTWTFSCWIKRNNLGDGSTSTTAEVVFSSGAVSVPWGIIQLNNNNTIQSSVFAGSSAGLYTNAVFRDTGSFFHLCSVFDTTATGNDKWRTYINGVQQTYSNSNYPSDNTNYQFNQANANHRIGYGEWYAGFQMSQCYFIDGQALGPENFGYTDPLTNTWRPKKASSSVFDKTYINDWVSQTTGTPYSGSYAIENAFNGTLSNRCSAADNTSIVFTPTTPIPINNSLRIYAKSDTLSGIFNINGVNEIGLLSNSLQWVSPSTIPSTLTSLEWATASGGLEESAVGAIEIDGNILLFGNVNTFYLPMDGNSPIGEDKSGNGNHWTPVNFGGSNTIEKATGALPILNTVNGGKVAVPGVFGSKVGAYYAVTVPGGTGGGFYLDGTQKPALNLIRGATYTFDQSDSSNSSHPLVFGTTAEGNDYSDGVTTSGTPGSAGAYTKITVPHNAPDTLYYHCSNHSGMGNSTSQTTNEKVADPYAWKNVLALPLVGSANDVSNQINSGSSTKTITVTNAVASSVQSNFYGGSYYFDGTGDYLTFTSGSDLQFGSGEFTIECYVYPNTLSNYDPIIDNGSIAGNNQHDWRLYLGSAGEVWFDIEHSNGSYFNASGVSAGVNYGVKANKWNHIAITRSGNTIYTFVNGVQQATTSFSGTIDSDYTTAYIGHDVMVNGTSYYFDGYMSDIRVYKGVAKYTSNFIPASTNPDILPDTPSGVSGSSKLTKVIDGAVSFDGSSSYLSVAHSTDFDLTNGDFTLEGYFNHTHTSGYITGCGVWREASGADFWSYDLRMTQNGTVPAFIWTTNGTGVSGTLSATTPTGNSGWHHIAVTRSGTSLRIFVDGKLEGSTTTSDTFNTASSQPFVCGWRGSSYYDGFMSNVRLIKGTALYTSDFTPPTSPLTNVTNTKLLCCQSTSSPTLSAVKPDASQTITANGDVSAATDNPFSSGTDGSTSFDGTGDYLAVASTSDFTFGTGDFTIEFWIKTTAGTGALIHPGSSTGTGYWGLFMSSDFRWNDAFNTTNKWTVSNAAITDGSWHHVAVCRSNSTFKVFYDGTPQSPTSGSFSDSTNYSGVDGWEIGGSGNVADFNGSISNLRITKGRARYSGNFTVPTSTLVADPDTVLLTCTSRTTVTDNEKYATVRNGNVAATNFNPFTTDINTVRGQESGYATWNPLSKYSDNFGATVSTVYDGNLSIDFLSGTNAQDLYRATLPVSSGKHYCEWTCKNSPAANNTAFIMGIQDVRNNKNWLSETGAYAISTGTIQQLWSNGTQTNYWWTGTQSAGDVFGFALDLDNSNIKFYHNGIQIGSTVSIPSGQTYAFAIQPYQWQAAAQGTVNFGQKPFKYAPPEGFQPLNASTVRPSTVIARPDKYFGTAIYSGTSSGGTTVESENINFTPDFVWVKSRNANENHVLYDSVRGYTKRLSTNNASQEATTNPASDLSGFIRGGYTVGGQNGHINYTGYNYVTWAWKAGGGSGSGGEFWKDDVQYANAAALNMNVGGQNSSVYNMSETWSNDLSATDPSFPAVDGFDGDLTTSARAQATAGTLTWTPTGGLAYTSSVRVYMSNTNYLGETLNLSLNGGTNVPVPSVGWYTLATGSGTITTISSSYTATYKGVFSAIEVDGKILVDSGATPTTQYPSIALTGASVGTKQGFSIVTYTANLAEGGATIAHGLTQEPDFAIFKNRDSTLGTNEVDWGVYHRSLGATKKMELNQALISETHTGPFNNTEPTSSLFYFGGKSGGSIQGHSYLTNGPANDGFVGYIWHDVPGLQKFGSYTGNGGSQFIELGFRPKMLMIKQATGTAYYWNIYDTERDPDNVCTLLLYPNASNSDDTWAYVDILSNGFRPVVSGNLNENGSTVIYAAWAEAPSINLYGAQSNAR